MNALQNLFYELRLLIGQRVITWGILLCPNSELKTEAIEAWLKILDREVARFEAESRQ